VVEDIHHQGQILQATTQTNAAGQQQTIVTTDAAKHDQAVIQAFLPARKRKPRVKKMSRKLKTYFCKQLIQKICPINSERIG